MGCVWGLGERVRPGRETLAPQVSPQEGYVWLLIHVKLSDNEMP
jgi:hypothetical protein